MNVPSVFKAGVILGAGMGGFLDGIVLHQILGWHHLICRTETCQPTSIAMLQQQAAEDGWFHLAVWVVTLAGIGLLHRARRDPRGGRTLAGGMLAGFGLFNFVEGLVDHQILGIHHVRPESPNPLLWDLAFLASGVVLLTIGWMLREKAQGRARATQP